MTLWLLLILLSRINGHYFHYYDDNDDANARESWLEIDESNLLFFDDEFNDDSLWDNIDVIKAYHGNSYINLERKCIKSDVNDKLGDLCVCKNEYGDIRQCHQIPSNRYSSRAHSIQQDIDNQLGDYYDDYYNHHDNKFADLNHYVSQAQSIQNNIYNHNQYDQYHHNYQHDQQTMDLMDYVRLVTFKDIKLDEKNNYKYLSGVASISHGVEWHEQTVWAPKCSGSLIKSKAGNKFYILSAAHCWTEKQRNVLTWRKPSEYRARFLKPFNDKPPDVPFVECAIYWYKVPKKFAVGNGETHTNFDISIARIGGDVTNDADCDLSQISTFIEEEWTDGHQLLGAGFSGTSEDLSVYDFIHLRRKPESIQPLNLLDYSRIKHKQPGKEVKGQAYGYFSHCVGGDSGGPIYYMDKQHHPHVIGICQGSSRKDGAKEAVVIKLSHVRFLMVQEMMIQGTADPHDALKLIQKFSKQLKAVNYEDMKIVPSLEINMPQICKLRLPEKWGLVVEIAIYSMKENKEFGASLREEIGDSQVDLMREHLKNFQQLITYYFKFKKILNGDMFCDIPWQDFLEGLKAYLDKEDKGKVDMNDLYWFYYAIHELKSDRFVEEITGRNV